MAKRGFDTIIVYLDDFLIVGETKEVCQLAFDTLITLLQHLGFEISWRKVIRPTQKLVFLGIEIDTWYICMHYSIATGQIIITQRISDRFQ